jgi:hypothetical protein
MRHGNKALPWMRSCAMPCLYLEGIIAKGP